jgi:uncharacterized delta-60 repeat protein
MYSNNQLRRAFRATAATGLLLLSATAIAQPGTLDPTFAFGSVSTNQSFMATVLQGDGKIVAAGRSLNGTNDDFAVVRCNPDGSLDAAFGSYGVVRTDFGGADDVAAAVAIQSDGKIVAAGTAVVKGKNVFAAARYRSDGSVDTTFGSKGKVTVSLGTSTAAAFAMALQIDGKIVLAGYADGKNGLEFALVRLTSSGAVDTSFGSRGSVLTDFGGKDDVANAVAIQPDGKILAAGYAFVRGGYDFGVARYNANGTLDSTFGYRGQVTTDFHGYSDAAMALALQQDGKVVVGGHAWVNGDDFGLVRYLSNGTLDWTFGSGGLVTTDVSGSTDSIKALAIQIDGRIVAAGTSHRLSDDVSLARYNADGSLDLAFGSNGAVMTDFPGYDDDGEAVVLQPDGKILVAGSRGNVFGRSFALVRYLGQ